MTRLRERFAQAAQPALLLLVLIAATTEVAAQAAAPTFVKPQGEIRFHIEAGDAETGYQPDDPELARWALAAWQRAGVGAFTFTPVDNPRDAQIRIAFVGARGLFGLANPYRSAAGTVTVIVNTATDGLGGGIDERARNDRLYRDTIVYLTCVHEIGHALGLVHTREFADVMYYFGYGGDILEFFGRYRARLESRADIARFSGLSPDDIAQLRATDSRIAPADRAAR